MTAQRKPLPVDDKSIDDVEEGAWDQDNTPARFYELLRGDERAQALFEAAVQEIDEHQATLAQVRKAQALSQVRLASLLDMDQSEVSRLERRCDMRLSTLRSFIRAAGGDLQLIATFPDATPVHLLVGEDMTQEEVREMAKKEKTGKKAASDAGKTLRSKSASKAEKTSAASALAQRGNQKVTRKKAASEAGKTLGSKSAPKAAAGSTLTQRSRKKSR